MFFAAAIIILLGDILTKRAVVSTMTLNTTYEVIPKLLSFTYIHNDGAAFGMFSGKQRVLIIATSVVLLGLIVYAIVMRNRICVWEKLSLGLIVGGGIGNLIERIMHGYVVDFIDTGIIPVFNVADIGVTIGCILLVITVLFLEPKAIKNE